MTAHSASDLRWYLTSHLMWYTAFGIQGVLFTYMAVVMLDLSGAALGIAQFALNGPVLFLMLPGGVIADRLDERRQLIRLHFLASMPALVLGVVILTGNLTYLALILFALIGASFSGIAIPHRDAMLSHIVPRQSLAKAVSAATMAQFVGQFLGMIIARQADSFGAAPVIIIQGALIFLGLFGIASIKYRTDKPNWIELRGIIGDQGRLVLEAIQEAKNLSALFPVLICNLAIGIFYVGTFLVVVPFIVRDYYNGGASELADLNIAFWAGTIISSLIILRRGGINRRGRGILIALYTGVVVMVFMSFKIPFQLFASLMFVWGLGGGVVMTTGRTVTQEAAPSDKRARMLALFQLGFFGGSALGVVLLGPIVDFLGGHATLRVPATGMFITLFFVVTMTKLWTLEARHTIEKHISHVDEPD